jgi:O-antigen ligase
MDREAIDTWLGRVILGLVLAALLFGPLALGAVRASEFVVVHWLILGALVVWLLRIWVAPTYRFFLPPTAWAVLPFLLYAVWRYRAADIEYVARDEFMQVLLGGVLFLVIVNNLYGQSETRVLVVGLVVVATIVAMYSIYQWLTGSQMVWHFSKPGYEGRGSGTYISPNHLAGLLEMVCPLAITLTVLRGFGSVARILFGYSALVMLVGIAVTASRGGWIAIAVGIVAVSVVLIRKRTHFGIALALLLVAGGMGKWFYSRVLEPRVYSQGQLAVDDVRLRLWASAKKMWKDHPWVGIGPDHFDHRYPAYRDPHWRAQGRPGRVHNDYWNTLADWGSVGFALILLPVTVAGFGVFQSWKFLQRSAQGVGTRAAIVLGAGAGLISLLAHSFFDFNMHIPANAFLATALLALIAVHWRFASQRFWLTARWPVQIVTTVLLLGTGGYLAREGAVAASEVLATRRAEKTPAGSVERIAALKEIWRVDPRNGETAYEIGEQLRARAWVGDLENYRELTLEAIGWFEKAEMLNRWDVAPLIRMGMCWDWLEEYEKGQSYFAKALRLDPNHWYTCAMQGWHYYQAGEFAQVRPWMMRSLELWANDNAIARQYLMLADQALAEPVRRENGVSAPRIGDR